MSDYKIEDITRAFAEIGINSGDDLFIHSNLGFFGRLENCNNRDDLCQAFYMALCETIGSEGTLVVPTFSYSFCHGEVYSPVDSKTECGMLSQYIMTQKEAIRSLDPNFSIAATGRHADEYTKDPTHESFGKGCFFERFVNNNGKILCMNFDAGSTFVHYVECKNKAPYRYNKAFNGIIKDGEKEINDYYVHFVYSYERPGDAPDMSSVNTLCSRHGIYKKTNLGKGSMLVMESQAYVDLLTEELNKNPRFMTKEGSLNKHE